MGDPMNEAKQPCIKLENVSIKYYGKKSAVTLAVEDVSFTVNDGEFVSIVGPSGCGKSTILKAIAGLLLPTKGHVYIHGKEVTKPQKGIGMAFQHASLLPWRTAMKNVLLPIEILGLNIEEYIPRAEELFETVGLKGFEDRYPWELSGGMQQRVSLIRSLIVNPEILLLDEPFGALDALTREELNLVLQRLWMHEKKTVVFVTHDIPEAVFLGDRVIVLKARPGKVIHEEIIDLPRPRSLDIKLTEPFLKHVKNIRDKLGVTG
ncbi:MAG: ABC transporter ATP-binding protein [Candidatus Asgardarchaeia archaeon]